MWQRVQGVGEAFGMGVGDVPPVPLGVFDTDLAPEALRADYYHAMLRSVICAATPSLGDLDHALSVRARNGRLGAALYAHVAATRHRIERSLADTRLAPANCYFLWRQTAASDGLFEVAGEQVRLAQGDVLLGDADEPFVVGEGSDHGFSLYLLPKAAVDPLLTGSARDRLAKGIAPAGDGALHRMITLCAEAAGAGEALAPAAAAGTGALLARLAAIAADEAAARTEDGRLALQSVRQGLILRAIDEGFPEPGFTAAEAAQRLGLSVRSLHLALEPTGFSFTEHLNRRRIAEARTLLAARDGRTVAEVAFTCGFNEVSTFYRAFRRMFDATPRDLDG
jgi:AraC-like DNA-binding protein